MYIIIILFLVSLIGIVIMLGRKLVLVRNGLAESGEHFHPFVPDLIKIKYLTQKSVKRYGYLVLVATLRWHIRFSNLLKYQYQKIKTVLKEMTHKHITLQGDTPPETREVSGFLKMISEYKHKIRNIKHKIKEEEGKK